MRDFRARGFGVALLLGAASFVLAAAPGEVCAQSGGGRGRGAVERRIETMSRQSEQYERDALERERAAPAAEDPAAARRSRDLAEQVRRDFDGLQAGYNKLVMSMASGARLDPDAVIDTVAGVKKCAARLRLNLGLPREKEGPAEKERGGAGSSRLEESLLLLRKHIYSFVTNPLFEARSVLDVEQAEKAGRDLDMILELSEEIRRHGAGQKARHE
ncbi:MAG TPA: hypothetical protein VEY09_07930 [Pyrinomonadaceae bacterium]|nr:hypothetical protein [Pyrinomonadaceae bacterium]